MDNKVHPSAFGGGKPNMFRAAGQAVVGANRFSAQMPSQMAHRSMHGTHLARRRIQNEKSKRRRQIDNSKNLQAKRRGTLSMETVAEAEKRGLKLTVDDDFDEIDRLKQVEIIKQMPISISVKRKLRDAIMQAAADDLPSEFCSLFCYKQKVSCYRCKIRTSLNWQEFRSWTTMFRGSFKRIDGYFGSGVLTYFKFLKWLFQVNIVVALAFSFFILVPQLAFGDLDYTAAVTGSDNLTEAQNTSLYCSAMYSDSISLTNHTIVDYVLDFLQGTGFMEDSFLFYGYYSDRELNMTFTNFNYNMPLAFLLVVLFALGFSLVAMVKNTAKGFKERLVSNHGSSRHYCNKVFAGWDWGMTDEKNCGLRHKSIHREIMSNLEEQSRAFERENYSRGKKCGILTTRIVINFFICLFLASSAYLIYFVTIKQVELTSDPKYVTYHRALKFIIGYMTSLTITILNGLMPIIFKRLVTWEDYSPAVEVNITLCRTVFLRLASLAVLIFTIYSTITCGTKDNCGVGTGDCTAVKCWETYAGQEFYKLVVMDFIIVVCIIFFVEFPRKLIVSKCDCKLSKIIGLQQFDIPKNVLDLIYAQTLFWLGCMFSPGIPVIATVKAVLVFYLKELTLLWNYVPNDRPFKATDAQMFFLVVLIIAYTLCSLPVSFILWRMTPSTTCGPFRIYSKMYDIIPITVETLPSLIQSVMNLIISAAILIPIFVILLLAIYYLNSMVNSYKEMVQVLKEQLNMEGQDKQFLMKKIHELLGGKKRNNEEKNLDKPPQYEAVNERQTDQYGGKGYLGSPPNVPIVQMNY